MKKKTNIDRVKEEEKFEIRSYMIIVGGYRLFFDYEGENFKKCKRLLIRLLGEKVEDEVWKWKHADELYFIDLSYYAYSLIRKYVKGISEVLSALGALR